MAQKTIKLNEGKLNSLIMESLKKVLKEADEFGMGAEFEAKDEASAKALFDEKAPEGHVGPSGFRLIKVGDSWHIMIVKVNGTPCALKSDGRLSPLNQREYEWATSEGTTNYATNLVKKDEEKFAAIMDSITNKTAQILDLIREFNSIVKDEQGIDLTFEDKFKEYVASLSNCIGNTDNDILKNRFAPRMEPDRPGSDKLVNTNLSYNPLDKLRKNYGL